MVLVQRCFRVEVEKEGGSAATMAHGMWRTMAETGSRPNLAETLKSPTLPKVIAFEHATIQEHPWLRGFDLLVDNNYGTGYFLVASLVVKLWRLFSRTECGSVNLSA